MTRTLLVILSGLMLVSCGSQNPATPSLDLVTNITWKLQSLQRAGSARVDSPDPERFTVRFGDDGRAAIRADCNTCGGSYDLIGSRLRLGALACTRAFCGNDSLDTDYLRVLDAAPTLSVAGGLLTIEGAGTVLTFRK